MATKSLPIRQFTGGIATAGEKIDVSNSFSFLKNLNPFENTSYIINSCKGTKMSGTTVTNLPLWADDGSPWDTNRYFLDLGGNIYRETNADVWSNLRTVSGCTGQGLRVFADFLYYTGEYTLGRYGKLSGTPAFSDDFLNDNTTNLDQSGGGTGATDYTTPTSISETATNRQTFTPDYSPLSKIIIDVDAVGTGNWTVTVHDAKNVLIGSKTIAVGNMSTGDITFTFATPLEVEIGNTYHFHVTSTVANGGVDTNVNADLEGAEFSTYFSILMSATFHPIEEFLNFLVIGNGRYLAKWDQAIYEPNKIVLPAGYEVRSIAKFNEFIIAGAYKGASTNKAESARLYFWDGIETTFNYFTELRIGAPNALLNHGNELLGVYGAKGELKKGTELLEDVVANLPKLTKGKMIEVYPGAITDYDGKTLIGYAGLTDDGTNFEQGVYEYGSQQTQLPESFNLPYTISTGTTQSTTVKIGLVKSIGSDLYIGWRDDTAYGVDRIKIDAVGSASGTLESLIFDSGDPDIEFLLLDVIVTFEELQSGQTVTPKWDLDRSGTWSTGDSAVEGDTSVKYGVNLRCKEAKFGFNFTDTNGSYIKITSVKIIYDDLAEERLSS